MYLLAGYLVISSSNGYLSINWLGLPMSLACFPIEVLGTYLSDFGSWVELVVTFNNCFPFINLYFYKIEY